mgnify:CR=1 FL=1
MGVLNLNGQARYLQAALLEIVMNNFHVTFTDKERRKLNKFIVKHRKLHKGESAGAIGGRFTYQFTPTGIGMVNKCGCACGESVDFTDYKSW